MATVRHPFHSTDSHHSSSTSTPPMAPQSQHLRDKGIACEIFVKEGKCPVGNCPYLHVRADTTRPIPSRVCPHYAQKRCLRDDCAFYHLPQAKLELLRTSGAAFYYPLEGLPTRNPLSPVPVPLLPAGEETGARRITEHPPPPSNPVGQGNINAMPTFAPLPLPPPASHAAAPTPSSIVLYPQGAPTYVVRNMQPHHQQHHHYQSTMGVATQQVNLPLTHPANPSMSKNIPAGTAPPFSYVQLPPPQMQPLQQQHHFQVYQGVPPGAAWVLPSPSAAQPQMATWPQTGEGATVMMHSLPTILPMQPHQQYGQVSLSHHDPRHHHQYVPELQPVAPFNTTWPYTAPPPPPLQHGATQYQYQQNPVSYEGPHSGGFWRSP